MRKFTFKSLLITVMLCLGTSAWAEETRTSVYSNNFETSSDFTVTGKGEGDGHQYTPGVSVANTFGSQILGGGKASGDKGFMSPQFSINEADIVDIDFKFKMDACTSGKSSGIYITTGKNTSGWLNGVSSVFSIKASANGNGYWGTITVGGEDLTSLLNTTGTYECNELNRNTTGIIQLNLRLNFLLQKATYSLTKVDGTVLVDNKTVDFESEASTIYGLFFCAGKSYGGTYIDDLNVYTVESDEVIATKDYVINYQYEGETIHSTEGNLAVGASVESESVITVDDVKYLSVNDAQKFEITADGTNTWDVEVRKPYTATLQVNTTINDVKAEGEIITFTESDDKVCSWSFGNPLYVLDEDVYCKLTDATLTYLSGTFTNGEEIVKELVYESANSVLYFAEFENSQEAGSSYPVSNVAGFSNGKGKAIMKTDQTMTQTFTVSDAGIYTISMPYKNTNNKSRDYKVTVDGVTGETYSIASGASGVYTNELELAKGEHNIVITCTYSLTPVFDYIVVENTDNGERNVSITSAGYATFSSACAVDFSESGLAAYTAKVNDGNETITLTKIANGIVPANTGVVLKGEAGDYTGTITTTDAVIDNNDLKASAVAVTGDGSIYVLNKVGENVGFYPLASGKTLAAGKAYLHLTSGAKGYTFVWNDGETTGIEENYEFGTMNSDAATFDLSGRKVANPAKGLYIKNGKKFIVK